MNLLELKQLCDHIDKRKIIGQYFVESGKIKAEELSDFIIGKADFKQLPTEYSDLLQKVQEVIPAEIICNYNLLNTRNFELYKNKIDEKFRKTSEPGAGGKEPDSGAKES